MPWIVGGAILGSTLLSSSAAGDAANAQAASAGQGMAEQRREYDLARADAAPYRAAGSSALDRITGGLEPGGQFSSTFTSSDLSNDPIYQRALQWATDQGTLAINRGAAARGGLDSGATIKDITNYALNQALLKGNDAFNRWNTQNSNIFNRNADVAGIGQTAVGQTTAAGTNEANNVTDLMTGAGNARAAGIVSGANAINSGVNSGINYYTGQQNLDKILAASRNNVPFYGVGANPY